MDPEAIMVVVELIRAATSAMTALKEISDEIQRARDEGRELTLDDLKNLQIEDDVARDQLEQAISDAEGR